MPLSHRRLATWYVQLAQQLDAGVPLASALRNAQGAGASRATTETMAVAVERGGGTDGALTAAVKSIPYADQLALSASAEAGRMPVTLHALASRHRDLAAAQTRVVLACLYPIAVLHLGLLLFPVTRMINWQTGFHWNTAAYLETVASTLLPIWVLIGALALLARRQSPILTGLARALPAFRGYSVSQSLADLSFALANFLEAGLPIGKAWAAAGLLTRSPALERAAQDMSAAVERGEPPGNHLARWPCIPAEFVALYRTGEATGQLETNLSQLSRQFQASANRSLSIAALLYPSLAFLLVGAAVVFFVVSLYAGYLKMITDMTK